MIHTCLRKVQYSLVRNLKSDTESPATLFGSAIHKALEHWYSLPIEKRALTMAEAKEADVLVFDSDTIRDGALESIRCFIQRGADLRSLDDADKRSLQNGVKILKAYFKQYADDGLEIVKDANGGNLIERDVEFRMYDDENVCINYFGTVDAVLRNANTGQLMVVDHKTTAALGKEFYNRIKPNHQYTGYIMGMRKVYGIDTNLFMVNAIQVAKTKCEFARQVTERTEEDFNELRGAVVHAVRTFLSARETNFWPQHAPHPCSNYGGCQFLDICSAPDKLRETIIGAKYDTK